MVQLENLALYQMEFCPFCVRVRHALEDMGLSIEIRDVDREPERRAELVTATGRGMVPCLRIEDDGEVRWMHESLDIIAYLKGQYANN